MPGWRFNPLLEEAAAVLAAAAPLAQGERVRSTPEIRWALGAIYLDHASMLAYWLTKGDEFVLKGWLPKYMGSQFKQPVRLGRHLESPPGAGNRFVAATPAMVTVHAGASDCGPVVAHTIWREVLAPVTHRTIKELWPVLQAAASAWPIGAQGPEAAERASVDAAVQVWQRVRPVALGGAGQAEQLSFF